MDNLNHTNWLRIHLFPKTALKYLSANLLYIILKWNRNRQIKQAGYFPNAEFTGRKIFPNLSLKTHIAFIELLSKKVHSTESVSQNSNFKDTVSVMSTSRCICAITVCANSEIVKSVNFQRQISTPSNKVLGKRSYTSLGRLNDTVSGISALKIYTSKMSETRQNLLFC